MSDDYDDLPLSTVLSRVQAAACEDLSCDCSIAFLFLTIGQIRNSDVWEAYFKSGGPTEYTIYVHAKKLPPAKQGCLYRLPATITVTGEMPVNVYRHCHNQYRYCTVRYDLTRSNFAKSCGQIR